jgi:YfiH family protein
VTPAAFVWRERDGVSWLAWRAAGVTAVFPARNGGVSAAPFDSLNLGLSVEDRVADVLENRRRLCAAVGLPQARLVVPRQVHGTDLRWVGEDEAGRGAFDSETVIGEHDGLLTRAPGLGLGISHADCVPVVIVAKGDEGPAYATVHAGWRGMLDGIVGKAAAELVRAGGRLAAAAVGPSIGPCCFTVDEELRRRFNARFPDSAGAGTVDLWRCARRELEAAGVPSAAIAVAGLCTSTDERFFSHRREGATGRHLAIAWRQEA